MSLAIENIEFDSLTSDPTTLVNGMIWYRSDLNVFRYRDNGITKEFSEGTPQPLPIMTLTSNDTSTTIVQSAPTILGWNIEREKDGGFTHDINNNNSRLTVDEDGTYLVHFNITLF